jgi:hypothetical protein
MAKSPAKYEKDPKEFAKRKQIEKKIPFGPKLDPDAPGHDDPNVPGYEPKVEHTWPQEKGKELGKRAAQKAGELVKEGGGMPFKRSPFPMQEGTSGHKSALRWMQYAKMGMDMMGSMNKGGDKGGGGTPPEQKSDLFKSDLSL